MKTYSIIIKSLKEQIRSFWMLLLNLAMGPFFIFVYFLITESSQVQYKIQLINNDAGIVADRSINYGKDIEEHFHLAMKDSGTIPFVVTGGNSREQSINMLREKKADALIIIPDSFSEFLQQSMANDSAPIPKVEFIGDLTNMKYLVSAVYANEIINEYTLQLTQKRRTFEVLEIALGSSASISEFDLLVPGILIISLIMLMYTASIAFVSEVENKTIIRLKLSRLTAFEFLGGITVVQLALGIVSVLLTLLTARILGFSYQGSLGVMLVVAVLTTLSIISFSLIIASLTRSANEVLVVGNIPMFLFMFFTGAAFPLRAEALFTVGGYPVSIQSLLSPSHAISAMNKTFILNMNVSDIVPEIISILVLTGIYFLIGGYIFQRRHLKLS